MKYQQCKLKRSLTNKKHATSSEASLVPEPELSDLEIFPGKTPPCPNGRQADGDATAEENRQATDISKTKKN